MRVTQSRHLVAFQVSAAMNNHETCPTSGPVIRTHLNSLRIP